MYFGVRNAFLRDFHRGECVVNELALTAWRVPFALLYLWLFLGEVRASGKRSMPRHALLLGVLVFAVAFMPFRSYGVRIDYACTIVSILTTIVVAAREELFYRVILQSALEKRMPPALAILVATAVFVASHIGFQPMNSVTIPAMAAAGVILGAVYQRTRSFALVAVLHFLYDVVALMPYFPVPPAWSVTASVLSIVWVMVWWRFDETRQQT